MKYLPRQALDWQMHSTVSLYSAPVPCFLLFTESFYLPMEITGQPLHTSDIIMWCDFSVHMCYFVKPVLHLPAHIII